MTMIEEVHFKIVLLGEGRVGKTSILTRYVQGTYSGNQPPTIQASYLEKVIPIENNNSAGGVINKKTAKLSIWDTAGQERYHALGPIYYRDADGAVIVYDITDATSYTRVQTWVKELRKVVGGEDTFCINIVGNKIDLESKRQVLDRDVVNYASSIGANHFLTSAKLNRGLDEIFIDITRRMMISKKNKNVKNILTGDFDVTGQQQPTIVISQPKPNEERGTCCSYY